MFPRSGTLIRDRKHAPSVGQGCQTCHKVAWGPNHVERARGALLVGDLGRAGGERGRNKSYFLVNGFREGPDSRLILNSVNRDFQSLLYKYNFKEALAGSSRKIRASYGPEETPLRADSKAGQEQALRAIVGLSFRRNYYKLKQRAINTDHCDVIIKFKTKQMGKCQRQR